MPTMQSKQPAFLRRALRITNARRASQAVFFGLFVFSLWATWTSRLGGYPVSRFLELDPLVLLATALSTELCLPLPGLGDPHPRPHPPLRPGFLHLDLPVWRSPPFHRLALQHPQRQGPHPQQPLSPAFFLKYSLLIVFLVMAAMGALQIGLLDPICLLYRSCATAVAPFVDGGVDQGALALEGLQLDTLWTDSLKFAPGVARRVFVGSFWIGLVLFALLAANLFIPRFFCRFLCPLGALLGVFSRFSLFSIYRDLERCTECGLCQRHCEGGCAPNAALRQSECLACMNCLDDCPRTPSASASAIPGNPLASRPGSLPAQGALRRGGGLFAFPSSNTTASIPTPIIRPNSSARLVPSRKPISSRNASSAASA